MADAGFVLVNLVTQQSYLFQFFPNENKSTDRANWEPQETTTGVKPLFYANREPRSLSFQELYVDNTDTNISLTPDLKDLRTLMDEVEGRGAPPPLLAIWGDRRERCVLQDLTIDEIMFTPDGNPIRAKIGLELLQIQEDDAEATSVYTIDAAT